MILLWWTFVLFLAGPSITTNSIVASFVIVTTPRTIFQSRISRQIKLQTKKTAAILELSILAANSANHEESMDTNIAVSTMLQEELADLGLTPEQISVVTRRLSVKAVAPTQQIQANLAWLRERFARAQIASLVSGLPSILGYDVDTNLAPTVAFYSEALLLDFRNKSDGDTSSHRADNNNVTTRLDPRVAHYLSDDPGLLEYNVHKRLRPRLERWIGLAHNRDEQSTTATTELRLNEDMLRALATKTDSRFEEWLMRSLFGAEEVDHNYGEQQQQQQQQQYQSQSHPPPFTPTCYMVLSNLQSGGNIGNIIRSASIFGCHECLVVGQSRYRLTGDHGSRFDLPRKHVWSHEEAREYLHQRQICIYGIEILEGASPIMIYNATTGVVDFPFDKNTGKGAGAAFVMGNEGQGLSVKQREICDAFIYIPQARGGSGSCTGGSRGGSASLNVACAATVVLQAYALWASYPTAERNGEKFVAKQPL